MKRYLLDTGIMGDFIDRRRGVHDKVQQAQQSGNRIGTCMPVVAELFYNPSLSAEVRGPIAPAAGSSRSG